jgi:hypothetical protein
MRSREPAQDDRVERVRREFLSLMADASVPRTVRSRVAAARLAPKEERPAAKSQEQQIAELMESAEDGGIPPALRCAPYPESEKLYGGTLQLQVLELGREPATQKAPAAKPAAPEAPRRPLKGF